MKKPRWHPSRCKVCGSDGADSGGISARGLCREHSQARFESNFDALQSHSGPEFHHWRQRIAASVGASLLDEQRSNP